MHSFRLILSCLSPLTLAMLCLNCSSGSATTTTNETTPAGAKGEQLVCDALASQTSCSDAGSNLSGCGLYGCRARSMSLAAAQAFAQCLAAPSCGKVSACETTAAAAIGGEKASQYRTLCTAKRNECSGLQDVCGDDVHLYPDIAEALTACMAKPCDQALSCVSQASATFPKCP